MNMLYIYVPVRGSSGSVNFTDVASGTASVRAVARYSPGGKFISDWMEIEVE